MISYDEKELFCWGRSGCFRGRRCRFTFCRSRCTFLRASWTLLARSVDLQVSHQLLLLGKHGLESVELGLKLLNGYLRLTNRSSRVLDSEMYTFLTLKFV